MKTMPNFNQNRETPERRKRQIPHLKYLIFSGRRKTIRRDEDKGKFIVLDDHGLGIFALAIIILAFSALDGLFTLYLISSGAREINPLMSYLIDFNPRFYLAVKCIVTTVGIIILIVLRNYKSKLFGIRISKMLITGAIVFFGIVSYQLYMVLS
jgi:hypothetical protein